jgi:hypothetical protein
MTIDNLAAAIDHSLEGTVGDAPLLGLQLEGTILMVGSLVAFSTTDRSWWLVPLVLFLPDVFMAGYLGGPGLGRTSTTWPMPPRWQY